MNRRIAALLLCLALLLSFLPAATPARAQAQSLVTVEADKTTARPGDTVTFTVYVQTPLDIYGIQFFLDIPKGLTYVAGSGAMVPGIAKVMGVDGDCSWTESSMQITAGGTTPFKNLRDEKLAIATFQCTVDANASGKLTVNTTDDFDGIENFGGFTIRQGYMFFNLDPTEYEMVGAEISVQTEPVFYATVNANRAEAANGEQVTFSVSIQSSVDVYGVYLMLDIPQGLTYTPGSGAVTSGIAATLGADGECSFTENGLQIILASSSPLKGIKDKSLVVATFKCSVDANAAGSLVVNTTTSGGGIENYGGAIVFQAGQFVQLPASHIRLSGAQVKVASATHSWAAALTSDATGHWYACSHCTEKGSFAAHVFENECDTDCSVCGFTRQTQHSLTPGWSSDAGVHWHECAECGMKLDEAIHQASGEPTATTDQICTVCGYVIAPALGIVETTPPPVSSDAATTPAITDKDLDPSVTPAPTEPGEPTAPVAQDGDNGSSFPWWILLVVAVILVGVAAVIFVTPKKKSRS